MSNKASNTPNGVGDKKEVRVERNVPNELIDEHIKNWAAQRDKNGNTIPGTDDMTIKVVFGDPYFKDNTLNKEQKDEGTGSSDTTVMENQGSKDLDSVTNGLFIQTRPAPTLEQSKESDKKKSSTKSTKETKERDEDTARE